MAEEKRLPIVKAAKILNMTPYDLRIYENNFKIDIPRDENDNRFYTLKELKYFRYIDSLKQRKFSDEEIKVKLFSVINSSGDDTKENNRVEKMDFNQDEFVYVPSGSLEYNNILEAITLLKNEIVSLKEQLKAKEKDELIAENARLKMRLKEKTYELVETREKMKYSKDEKKKLAFNLKKEEQ